MAVFSLMQFLFAWLWGRISDRVGRRPILLIGLVGSVVFYTLFGYATDLPPVGFAALALILLFVSRAGAGVAGATIATAQAVVADCTPPEKRKHGMALIGMAFGVGFTFGPLVAAAACTSPPTPAASSAMWPPACRLSRYPGYYPPARDAEVRRGAAAEAEVVRPGGLAVRPVQPRFGPVVWTFFLTTLGFAMFEPTLAFLNRDALTLTDRRNSYIFAFVGLVLALDQGFLYRRLARKWADALIAVGMVLMGLGVASLAVVELAGDGAVVPPGRPLLGRCLAPDAPQPHPVGDRVRLPDAVGPGAHLAAHRPGAAGRDPRRQPVGVGPWRTSWAPSSA